MNNVLKYSFSFLIFLLLNQFCFAQNISGVVTDSDSHNPLAGVSVKVLQTNQGTVTDANGRFSIETSGFPVTLIFSSIGYRPDSIVVRSSTPLNVTLHAISAALSEVVVTGLGVATTQAKSPIEITSVSSKDFEKSATTNIGQAIMGQIAGAQIQQTSGQAGVGVSIILRGINSLDGHTPMILLDGVEVTDLNGLDPSTVDHIEIVKGAAAGMLYGAQGANGVIQIFTKHGAKNQPLHISVSSKLSIDKVLTGKRPLLAHFHHYVTNSQGVIVGPDGNPLKPNAIGFWPDPNEENWTTNPDLKNDKPYVGMTLYDHLKQAYRTAHTWAHSLSITGGGEKIDYAFTVSRLDQQSIFGQGYNRTNLTANAGITLAKGLTFRSITQGYYAFNNLLNGNRFNLVNSFPWINFLWRDSLGHLVLRPKNENQLNSLSEQEWHVYNQKDHDLIQNFQFNYDFPRFVTLSYKYGFEFSFSDQLNYYKYQKGLTLQPESYWGPSNTGYIRKTFIQDFYQNSLFTFLFKTDFENDFHLQIPIKTVTQVAYDWRRDAYKWYYAQGTGLTPFPPFNISLAENKTSSDFSSAFATYGILVNQSIDYGNLAGISAGFRSDWSSEFGDASKPFTFPRGTIYFRPSELMHSNFVPNWKLRAAYGEAGIQPPRYSRQITLDVSTLGNGVALAIPSVAANPDLQVQKSKELEIGTDFTLNFGGGRWLRNIDGSISYWDRKSEDIIQQADVAPSTGSSKKIDNLVSLESKGEDISLDLQMYTSSKFEWNMGIRWGHAKTMVVAISNHRDVISGPFALKEGQELGIFYTQTPLHSITQLMADGKTPYIPANQASNYTIVNGMVVNKNTNTVVITANNDLSNAGSAYPKFTSSLINNFTLFGNLYINIQFDWHYGNKIYNLTRQWLYRDRLSKDFDDPVNIDGKVGAFVAFYNSLYNTTYPLSWFVEDGSFIRLRNLSITYSLGKLVKKPWLNQLDLTIAGRNLLTFTKYKGLDPENTSNVDSQGNTITNMGAFVGVDDFGIPNYRSWEFQINLTF